MTRVKDPFDADYYARFYESSRTQVHSAGEVAKLCNAVVSLIEWWQHPIRTVLDVGAGVGHWGEWLRKKRPSVTYRSVQIPQPNDPWASFLAPEHVCPGRADGGAAAEAQQRTVVCLLDYARARQGLAPLAHSEEVSQWSALKARAEQVLAVAR